MADKKKEERNPNPNVYQDRPFDEGSIPLGSEPGPEISITQQTQSRQTMDEQSRQPQAPNTANLPPHQDKASEGLPREAQADEYETSYEGSKPVFSSAQSGQGFQGDIDYSDERSYESQFTQSAAPAGQGQSSGQISRASEQTRQKMSDLSQQARQKANDMVAQRKDQAAGVLDDFSQTVRQTAHQFDEQQHPMCSRMANRVADQVEHFSHLLHEKDLNHFVSETENLARRSPKLFLGGALAAGFMLARFMKSSSAHPQSTHLPKDPEQGAYYTPYSQTELEGNTPASQI